MATFSQLKISVDEIAQKINTARNNLKRAQTTVSNANSELGGMPTVYGTIITEIDAFLANNPDDPAAQTLKADKDQLVSEFNALNTTSAAMKADLDTYTL